jgi:selenide,water dikinase
LCADIDADAVPAISQEIGELISRGCIPGGTKQNLYSSTVVVNWKSATDEQRTLLTDAQTSGGLLLCVPGPMLPKVSRVLHKAGAPCAVVIGRMVDTRRGPLICMTK